MADGEWGTPNNHEVVSAGPRFLKLIKYVWRNKEADWLNRHIVRYRNTNQGYGFVKVEEKKIRFYLTVPGIRE